MITKRRIITTYRMIGRTFKVGDLIILDYKNDALYHIYTDDDTLFPTFLEFPISNINPDNIVDLLTASENVLE